jgi:hypothetical protein
MSAQKWYVSIQGPKGFPNQKLATDGRKLFWSSAGRMPGYVKRAVFSSQAAARAAAETVERPSPSYRADFSFWMEEQS